LRLCRPLDHVQAAHLQSSKFYKGPAATMPP
jgi:hypothetical protein